MEELQKYVPTHTCHIKHSLPNGDFYTVEEQAIHPILSGGDQLTCCRCGAQSLRCNHESTLDRLEGLVPVTEDWHARLTLVKVDHNCICVTSISLFVLR